MKDNDILNRLNTHLALTDDQLLEACGRGFGSLFIIGLPRCASTFFIQILGSVSKIGYINNRLAKFWNAPITGTMIDTMLGQEGFVSSFKSEFGNTQGDYEPHEWGWFWKKELGLKNDDHYMTNEINSGRLDALMNTISFIKGGPVIYDNVYAMLNLDKLKTVTPGIFPVNLKRDLFFIANSIVNARENRYGDIQKYYGYPTRDMEQILDIENPIEQVVAQVHAMHNDVKKILAVFNPKQVYSIEYENLIRSPIDEIYRFKTFVKDVMKFDLKIDENKIEQLPELKTRNYNGMVNPKYKKELEHYFAKWF